MLVTINGESMDLPQGASVGDVVRTLGLSQAPCAAEVNRTLVSKRDRDAKVLCEGDVVEIVTLVGGG